MLCKTQCLQVNKKHESQKRLHKRTDITREELIESSDKNRSILPNLQVNFSKQVNFSISFCVYASLRKNKPRAKGNKINICLRYQVNFSSQ